MQRALNMQLNLGHVTAKPFQAGLCMQATTLQESSHLEHFRSLFTLCVIILALRSKIGGGTSKLGSMQSSYAAKRRLALPCWFKACRMCHSYGTICHTPLPHPCPRAPLPVPRLLTETPFPARQLSPLPLTYRLHSNRAFELRT